MIREALLATTFVAGITPVHAAEEVRIGFVATFTGANAMLGSELLDGFKLGLQKSGGKLGGLPVNLIIGDDQAKPDVGRQLADKIVEQDKVDIVVGMNFSNVLLAAAKPILKSETFLFSVGTGPSQLAGKQCDPYFFVPSYQNDGPAEAMGAYMTRQNISGVYLMAPNYPAGKDLIAGFKRFYKGEIVKEVYTKLDQLDFAAELAALRSAKPKAVFFFYPGSLGISFIKQYDDAGLKKSIPLYGPSFSFDQTIFPAVGDAPIGATAAAAWTEKIDNPENKEFVASFEKAYGRLPSGYAAQAYDTARLFDAAIGQVGGKIEDKAALREAFRKADFKSIRGPFKFNNNQYPIENYYIANVEKDEQGRTIMKPFETALVGHTDSYASECTMD
ncbi:ABC transporter substrate-binding protein [Ensifer adhaerens]|uniref:ABC transporter substrate-binding protein n=1 Tax=Ensifer TaxID=106591 RepID=UPI00178074B3|nr:ABC transporter substrate-binding protein [Ensifer sp. ENS08]MBD9570792.1 ABC transporter substrate-binding protein [Ensifer sp. ENS08]